MVIHITRPIALRITGREISAMPLNVTEEHPPPQDSSLGLDTSNTTFFLVIIWAVIVTSFGLLYLSSKIHTMYRMWRFHHVYHTHWYQTADGSNEARRRSRVSTRQWIRDRRETFRRWTNRRFGTPWSMEALEGEVAAVDRTRALATLEEMPLTLRSATRSSSQSSSPHEDGRYDAFYPRPLPIY